MSKFFKPHETACKCGCGGNVSYKITEILDTVREIVNYPLIITSGFRCVDYNAKVGGAKHSYHTQGIAVDISTVNLTPDQKHLLLQECLKRFNGVGISNNFIHVDRRKRDVRALWTYKA